MIDAIENMIKGLVPYLVWLKRNTPVFRLFLNGKTAGLNGICLTLSLAILLYYWIASSGSMNYSRSSELTMMLGAISGYLFFLFTLFPLLEVFFVVPTHWWRRRKAKKQGKDSYVCFWLINGTYSINRTFLVWLKRNTLMLRLLINSFRSFVFIIFLGMVINYLLWLWVFAEIPDFSPQFVSDFVKTLVVLLFAIEVFVVVPTHWWRRRKAKKQGKDSYKSVSFIKCQYSV